MIRRITALILIAGFAAGCPQIPQSELGQYREAFSAAKSASQEVLIDFSQTLEASRALAAAQRQDTEEKLQASPFPIALADWEHANAPSADQDLQVRLAALETIDRYNETLAQLAEGKSIESVRTAAGGLADSVGKFVGLALGTSIPGFSQITAFAKELLGELESARVRQEFVKALEKGAPVVDGMLAALLQDAEDHYKMRVELNSLQYELTLSGMGTTVGNIMRIVRDHRSPGEATLKQWQDRLDEAHSGAHEFLLGRPGYPYLLAPGPATRSATNTTSKAQVESSLEALKDKAKVNAGYRAQVEALGQTLTEYKKLLRQTQAALGQLRRAAKEPQDLRDLARDISALAFGVRKNIADLRAALAGGKS